MKFYICSHPMIWYLLIWARYQIYHWFLTLQPLNRSTDCRKFGVCNVVVCFQCTIMLWLSLIDMETNYWCPSFHSDMKKVRMDVIVERVGISNVPLICIVKHPFIAKFLTILIGISSDARLWGAASDICFWGDFAVPRGVATHDEVNVASPHGIEQGSVRKERQRD
jgi:hypothetical protein